MSPEQRTEEIKDWQHFVVEGEDAKEGSFAVFCQDPEFGDRFICETKERYIADGIVSALDELPPLLDHAEALTLELAALKSGSVELGHLARIAEMEGELRRYKSKVENPIFEATPTCVWLKNGQKISLKRDGMRAWMVVEDQVMVHTAQPGTDGGG